MTSRKGRPPKRLLIRSGIAGLVLALIAGIAGAWSVDRARQSNAGGVALINRLAVPPLLEPSTDERGRKVFDLAFVAGRAELIPSKRTDTWGLNGPYLAPTLRASRGEEVVVNVANGVDEPTTLHWHGVHLPAEMDGGPHQMIEPGATWSPTWTVDQPAATLWFHPHPRGATADHVYRGAAGLFLLDDAASRGLALPARYGVDDIPLIIQDKRFDDDGSLDVGSPPFGGVGILGDTILVYGTYGPVFEATTMLVRLRVLNASNARVYNLGFADDRTFSLVGTDAGLLEAPVALTRLHLSPGERVEIVVRVAPGEDATLRSFPPDLGLDFFAERMNGGDDSFDLLRIGAADRLAESLALPSRLVGIDRPDEASAARTRSFALEGASRINGAEMDMTRIDAAVAVDTTEIWEIRNASGTYHNFHVHDVHFAVLDKDGEAPPAHLLGWKDTVFLPPGGGVRIIARFDDDADPDAPFMFHCHVLPHEDRGMMGQFIVVGPGADPPARITGSHAGHHQEVR